MPRGNSSPVSRRRFASARSSRCSTSFQSMKRQPAVRCCGLSAFCAAVCTNESSSCRGAEVVESRFEVGLGFQEELGEVFDHLKADRTLEVSHVRSVQRLCVCREVPLHVAQFDVWSGVAHDAAKFLRNVLWCTIQNQEPGYQLSVTSARVHVRVNRVDVDTCRFKKSCRLLLLPCPSILPVVPCVFTFFASSIACTNVTAINVVPVSEEICARTTKSGACGLIRKTHQVLT